MTRWKSGPTRAIRVPAALADEVLAFARKLDAEQPAPPPPAVAGPVAAPPMPPPAPLAPPEWARHAVFYQIFPDRFFDGDHDNDPARVRKWGTRPANTGLYGGDLAGVRRKLPYLRDLGVTALYLNPIFKARSNHKYDTADYLAIDPGFGTEAEFLRLVDDAHAAGLRVILDGVFNHTGDAHAFFRDCERRGPASPYWSWYRIASWPVVKSPRPNYEAWWGYASLPKLQVAANRQVQEYVFAVTEHWTRKGIDGWRLDVPNEITSPSFWAEWRSRVRAINPQAYLVGEIWDEGPGWVGGHPFDAVTDYVHRGAVLDFFAHRKISVDEFDARLEAHRRALGPAAPFTFNLLGSHDVPRLLTEAGGDALRAAEALTFHLLSAGVPVIYYGDEVGLAGGKDPDNRRCFPWSRTRDSAMLAHVRRLIALRRAHPALRGPATRTLGRHNHWRVYAFVREGDGERLLVVLNSGDVARTLRLPLLGEFPDGLRLVDLLGGGATRVEGGAATLRVPPRGAAVYGVG